MANGQLQDEARSVSAPSEGGVILVPRDRRGAEVDRLVAELGVRARARDLTDIERRLRSGRLSTAGVLRETAGRILDRRP